MAGDASSLDKLTEKLRTALGDDLISVVLYGSAAIGDDNASFSDYNVLCVLREIAPKHLGATETIFRWWREQGNPAPLLLTEHEVATSTDCFAIEFEDIKAHNRILFGRDVVSSLQIDRVFYRAQVERELRAKLLRLRQKAAGVLSDKDVLRRLLADSLSTFCVLFRHALMLHGVDSPARKREVISAAVQRFAIDSGPFMNLLDLREERLKPKDVEPEALLASYLKQIEKVIDAVDVLAK